MLHREVDIGGREQAIFDRQGQGSILGAAAKISPCFYRECRGLFEGENEAVALMDIMDGPAVRHNITFEAPLFAQSAKKELVRAGWHAANGIVGAHHGIGMSFHNRGTKRGSVSVGEIMRRNGHIFAVAKS